MKTQTSLQSCEGSGFEECEGFGSLGASGFEEFEDFEEWKDFVNLGESDLKI